MDFENQCTLIKEFDISSPFHGSVPVIDVLDIPEKFQTKDVPAYFRRDQAAPTPSFPTASSSLCYAVKTETSTQGMEYTSLPMVPDAQFQ